jgi:hypothetical protein
MLTVKAYPNILMPAEPQGTLRTSNPQAPAPYNVTPIGSTTFTPIFPQMASIYSDGGGRLSGASRNFNISDLPPTRGEFATEALNHVSTNTLSNPQDLGATGVVVGVEFQNPNGQCDINLYMVVNSQNVLLKQWTGVVSADVDEETDSLYCGHADAINIGGNPLVVEALNIMNGAVDVYLTPTN